MRDIELYRQILGVEAPWYVKHVELDLEAGEVRIQLSHHSDPSHWRCPVCQDIVPIYDHREDRIWRHLDTCQYKIAPGRVFCVRCRPAPGGLSPTRDQDRGFSLERS